MSVQAESINQKSIKPQVAGIINIIIGAGCLLGGLGAGMAGIFAMPFLSEPLPFVMPAVLGFLAVPVILVGLLIIIGGIFALQRRQWGWALAGAIASACISHVFGVVAIVLVAISKKEFDR